MQVGPVAERPDRQAALPRRAGDSLGSPAAARGGRRCPAPGIGELRARTHAASPLASSTAMAFGFMMIPAPTVASFGRALEHDDATARLRPSSRARARRSRRPRRSWRGASAGAISGRKAEQRGQPLRLDHGRHRLVGRPALEAAGRVEHLGQRLRSPAVFRNTPGMPIT